MATKFRVMSTKHQMQALRKLGDKVRSPGPGPRRRPGQRADQPAFDWPAHKVGTVRGLTVWVADELGSDGDEAAQGVIDVLGPAVDQLMGWFGLGDQASTGNLLIAPISPDRDGTGGAYHYGCDGTDLYADASYGDDGSRTAALAIAELSEVLQAQQGRGWDCGASNGEGLSRLHAEVCFPGALDDYSTFGAWLDGSRADWVNNTDATDLDAESTGCAVGWLTWLLAHQEVDVAELTQAAGATLAECWANLELDGSAWDDFRQACEELWPAGEPSGVETDDPWGEAPPEPPPEPVPEPASGDITLAHDLSAGAYTLVPAGGQPQGEGLPQEVSDAVRQVLDSGVSQELLVSWLQFASSNHLLARGGKGKDPNKAQPRHERITVIPPQQPRAGQPPK